MLSRCVLSSSDLNLLYPGVPALRQVVFLCLLPSRSGDWFYQFVEAYTLVVILLNIYLIMKPLKYTHNVHHVAAGAPLTSRTRGVSNTSRRSTPLFCSSSLPSFSPSSSPRPHITCRSCDLNAAETASTTTSGLRRCTWRAWRSFRSSTCSRKTECAMGRGVIA